MQTQEPGTLRIAIVGGGLVGSLAASNLKQRLKNVEITVFEKQPKTPENSGRFIKLTKIHQSCSFRTRFERYKVLES